MWAKYVFETTLDNSGGSGEVFDCKISKDQKIAVAVAEGSKTGEYEMNIIVINLTSKSTTTFTEKTGVFIDKIIGEVDINTRNGSNPYPALVGLTSPDNRTIILQKRQTRLRFLNKKFLLIFPYRYYLSF